MVWRLKVNMNLKETRKIQVGKAHLSHLLNLFFERVATGCWKQWGWQGCLFPRHVLLAFARERRVDLSILDLSNEVWLFLYQTWSRECLNGLPLSSWWSDWLKIKNFIKIMAFWRSCLRGMSEYNAGKPDLFSKLCIYHKSIHVNDIFSTLSIRIFL